MKKLILSVVLIGTVFYACKHDPEDMPTPSGNNPIDTAIVDTTTTDTTITDTTITDTTIVDTLSPVGPCGDTSNITFSGYVDSVLTARCKSCHNNSGASGGVSFSTYNTVITQVNNGKLLSSIKRDGGASPMPQGQPKLDSCVIVKIEKWITDGAPNN